MAMGKIRNKPITTSEYCQLITSYENFKSLSDSGMQN